MYICTSRCGFYVVHKQMWYFYVVLVLVLMYLYNFILFCTCYLYVTTVWCNFIQTIAHH